MSKSLGNFASIRDVLATTHPEVLRYFIISGHYRSQLEYSPLHIENSSAALQRLYVSIRGLNIPKDIPQDASLDVWEEKFKLAMNDDFNTPVALSVLFDLAREINKTKESSIELAANMAAVLKKLANILGILLANPDNFLQKLDNSIDTKVIENLIKERNSARSKKNWAAADAARDKLTDMGIVLEDTATGTTWRKV
jgi:cysteinyl-tRNA synthetase